MNLETEWMVLLLVCWDYIFTVLLFLNGILSLVACISFNFCETSLIHCVFFFYQHHQVNIHGYPTDLILLLFNFLQ
jgi:hypothetical protein